MHIRPHPYSPSPTVPQGLFPLSPPPPHTPPSPPRLPPGRAIVPGDLRRLFFGDYTSEMNEKGEKPYMEVRGPRRGYAHALDNKNPDKNPCKNP